MDDVAIYIPAKGRSTGIADKNLAKVGGRPLFLWSIECGLSLVGPRQIFVSTDSDAIAHGAAELGATVLARPRELAADDATVAQCLLHDLPAVEHAVGADSIIAVLMPTSPFRRPEAMRDAIRHFRNTPDARRMVAVQPFPAPITFALRLDDETQKLTAVEAMATLHNSSRRQQHETAYYPNGSFYLVRTSTYRDDPRFFVEGATLGFRSDRISSIDIDEHDDLELARRLAMTFDGKSNADE